jgi:cytochrome c oxidase subunit 1
MRATSAWGELYSRLFTAHGTVGVFGVEVTIMVPMLSRPLIGCGTSGLARAVHKLAWVSCVATAIGAIVLGVGLVAFGWERFSDEATLLLLLASLFAMFMAGTDVVATVTGHLRRRITMRYPTFEVAALAAGLGYLTVAARAVGGLVVAREAGAALEPAAWLAALAPVSRPLFGLVIGPAVGLTSDLIATRVDRSAPPRLMIAAVSLVILHAAVLEFAPALAGLLLLLTALVIVITWTRMASSGHSPMTAFSFYALGCGVALALASLSRAFLVSLSADVHLPDTTFAIASVHEEAVSIVFAFAAAVHACSPRATRADYPARLGRLGAALLVCGLQVSFLLEFHLGSRGLPRRYAQHLPLFHRGDVVAATGAYGAAVGFVLALVALYARREAAPSRAGHSRL